MQIVSNIALISINETIIIQLISFLIFLFIINRVMFRPLGDVMRERDNHIEQIKVGIVDAEKELDNTTNQLKELESAAKNEAYELKKELESLGSQKAGEIFESTRKEILTLKESTEREVNARISEARKEIKKESEVLAVRIMEKVLDRRLVP